jgi:cyclophilin family peptidyl-prolyl cis-trans isomerase
MSIKKIARAAAIVGVTAAACVLPALSGCTIKTNHPSVTVTLTFNGEDYALKYKLYRNMYPQTVLHFIELADNGFYDNTIIHNYSTSSYWYGGGYAYNDDYKTEYANSSMSYYLETNSKEETYNNLFKDGKLTPSVYKSYINGSYTDALATLIGEFSTNKHTIDNGSLKSSYGCLRMFYSSKTSDKADTVVYIKKDGNEDKELLAPYKYNSATSLFSIQLSTTSSTDSSYCIFGELKDSDPLEDLQDAIADFISNSDDYTTSTFTTRTSVTIDNYDEIIGSATNSASYSLPAEPLVVKSVKVTKY